jgi:hypothetical protein
MTLAALTVAMGVLAYELCMTVTTLGGYAPLALITAAPAIGYVIGRAVK